MKTIAAELPPLAAGSLTPVNSTEENLRSVSAVVTRSQVQLLYDINSNRFSYSMIMLNRIL
jgi:hypothetical protein